MDIDPTTTRSGLITAFRAISQACADQPFYLIRDVSCGALERLIMSCGQSATRRQLIHLEQLFWTAAIPTTTPADGAIETLTQLRDAGVRTAIVSFADIAVFEALLKQTGLAGLTDSEVCSELARSCKPHPEIFNYALRSVGVDPSEALFVGDDVDTDIVGGNRIGMRTALLSARQFTLGGDSIDNPETRPDHYLDSLLDVVDLVFRNHASQ
jgi:putative hydrolase of the HAD superfamily